MFSVSLSFSSYFMPCLTLVERGLAFHAQVGILAPLVHEGSMRDATDSAKHFGKGLFTLFRLPQHLVITACIATPFCGNTELSEQNG